MRFYSPQHQEYSLPAVFCAALIAAAVFFSTGCTGYSVTGGPGPLVGERLTSAASPLFEPLRVNEIAVLPFDSDIDAELDESSAEILSSSLVKAFTSRTSMRTINSEYPNRIAKALGGIDAEPRSLAKRAESFGRALSAQAVLYGAVSKYSGLQPKDAAVAFKLWLMDPASGESLWTATYAVQNKPLTDNLFRVQQALDQGIVFESRRELISKGFEQAAVELQNLRSREEEGL